MKRSAEDEQRGSTRRQGAAAELTARRDPPGLMMPKYQSWRPPFLEGTKVRMSDWPWYWWMRRDAVSVAVGLSEWV